MFLDRFDALVSKIIYKKKKKYFNIFLSENTLKNNHNYIPKDSYTPKHTSSTAFVLFFFLYMH